MLSIEQIFKRLFTAAISLPSVRAIGKTGGSQIPVDPESDVDLFVFCEQIPPKKLRETAFSSLNGSIAVDRLGDYEDVHWGLVDSLRIGDLEVSLMFFTIDTFSNSLEEILRGERLDREANYFYPTGRCASILGMHAFYDPARYLENAKVVNSIVADGCIVDGTVEHCVLFRGVKIATGARVKNCVIMQDSQIEEGVQLENCILDKQAIIKRDGRLIGPNAYPIVISKDMTI